MKYTVHYSKRFEKALHKVRQLPAFKAEKLKEAITLLSLGQKMPLHYKDHSLHGDMRSFRECHLAPNILLIYEIDEGILTLTLVNIGSHSRLFK